MSCPCIVYNKYTNEEKRHSLVYNNFSLIDDDYLSAISSYKRIIFYLNRGLVGPLPISKLKDFHILIYSNSFDNLENKHFDSPNNNVSEFLFLFYHISQSPFYTLKLKEIEKICENWFHT